MYVMQHVAHVRYMHTCRVLCAQLEVLYINLTQWRTCVLLLCARASGGCFESTAVVTEQQGCMQPVSSVYKFVCSCNNAILYYLDDRPFFITVASQAWQVWQEECLGRLGQRAGCSTCKWRKYISHSNCFLIVTLSLSPVCPSNIFTRWNR